MPEQSKKLKKIAHNITEFDLKRTDSDLSFDFNELHSEPGNRASDFFLGYYSKEGIRYALEKYGVFKTLKKKGFDKPVIVTDQSDPYRQRLAIYYDCVSQETLLYETVLSRKKINLDFLAKSFEFLFIEWITLQNPKKDFSEDKPPLPGQTYPGLAIGELVFNIFILTCQRLKLSGIINVPEYFHNAFMYEKHFHYLKPDFEGRFLAIKRDLLPIYSLAEVSWAIELGCVTENQQAFSWFPARQMIVTEPVLENYFQSPEFQKAVGDSADKNSYYLDRECLKNKYLPLNFNLLK